MKKFRSAAANNPGLKNSGFQRAEPFGRRRHDLNNKRLHAEYGRCYVCGALGHYVRDEQGRLLCSNCEAQLALPF